MLDQNARPCDPIYFVRVDRPDGRPLLLDGAMGTELIARGLQVRHDCPEAWNVDRADDVRAVHASHAQAGAELVQTNTFGATRPRLARFGLEGRQRELIAAAVRLAREGAPGLPVVGSLGPSGETLPLDGGGRVDQLEDAFAEAADLLAGAGAEAIHIETQFHPGELSAAVRGAKKSGLPVIASMSLMPGASGLETPHGVPAARMIRAVEAAEPDAVGVNCAIEGERMRAAVELLRAAFKLPIWAKPQAKMSPKCVVPKSEETPENFARWALELVEAGASAVGGCCGVGASGIAALRLALDDAAPKRPS
jgi:5-methyltetrahydrofolate--homocysteine methyltransferase